jgi:hypothetical protein
MRQPYSEFEFGLVRLALWAAAILLIALIVGLTWGCGDSPPSTGRMEIEVDEEAQTITWEELDQEVLEEDVIEEEEPDDG